MRQSGRREGRAGYQGFSSHPLQYLECVGLDTAQVNDQCDYSSMTLILVCTLPRAIIRGGGGVGGGGILSGGQGGCLLEVPGQTRWLGCQINNHGSSGRAGGVGPGWAGLLRADCVTSSVQQHCTSPATLCHPSARVWEERWTSQLSLQTVSHTQCHIRIIVPDFLFSAGICSTHYMRIWTWACLPRDPSNYSTCKRIRYWKGCLL